MQFLIDLAENRSFTLSNNLYTGGFVPVFHPGSLKTGVTLITDSVCFYGAVLGPIFWSSFSMVDASFAASRDELLERPHVWKGGKQQQPGGGSGAGRKHLAGGVASSLGDV